MLLFSFSIEKNKLAGLVNINQNRHRNAIQGRKEVKAQFNSLEPCKALNRFKIENQKNQKQILFSSEKKSVALASKKTYKKTALKVHKKRTWGSFKK